MDIFDVLLLIGGLALFLYGMNEMGNGLEKVSGGKLKSFNNLSIFDVLKYVYPSNTHLSIVSVLLSLFNSNTLK